MHIDLSLKQLSLPTEIAVFSLSGAVLLPGVEIPLNLYESKYIQMADDAFANGRYIGILQPRKTLKSKIIPIKESTYEVGCLGKVKAFNETEDGRYFIVLEGVSRFKKKMEIDNAKEYRSYKVSYDGFIDDFNIDEERSCFEDKVSKVELMAKVASYIRDKDLLESLNNIKDAEHISAAYLMDFLCCHLPLSAEEKQVLIEAKGFEERYNKLFDILGMSGNVHSITSLDTMH